MRRCPTSILLLAPILALAWPAPDARAQFGRSNSAPRGAPAEAPRPPPPALPGLTGRRAPEPIPADPAQNLAPNAALFDAINRGDLPAARESIARGADTEARNVLGLTPVEAAVDQGQREIMFYLLSVRGAPRGTPAAELAAEAASRAAPATPSRRPDRAGRPAAEPRETAPTPVRAPRLWAGDGGAPQPEIGFLGFDAGRPPGAGPPVAEARPRPARSRVPARG